MNKPLLSVAFLTYNQKDTIRMALDSILEQKTKYPYEIIIHDDASTDGTTEIVKEYAQKYPDIITALFETENQYSKGKLMVKTFIYPKIKGKYWCILEGDDYWCYDKKIEEALDFLETNPEYNMYGTDTLFKLPDKELSYIKKQIQNKKFDPNLSFKNFCYMHTSSRIYRNVIDYSKIPDKFAADLCLFCIFLDKGKTYCDNKITSVYRASGGAYSSKPMKEKEFREIRAFYRLDRLFGYKYHQYIIAKHQILKELENYVGMHLAYFICLSVLYLKWKFKK